MSKEVEGKTTVLYDNCVYCGKVTTEPRDKPIDLRMCYIEGAGQLCIECNEIIYN